MNRWGTLGMHLCPNQGDDHALLLRRAEALLCASLTQLLAIDLVLAVSSTACC